MLFILSPGSNETRYVKREFSDKKAAPPLLMPDTISSEFDRTMKRAVNMNCVAISYKFKKDMASHAFPVFKNAAVTLCEAQTDRAGALGFLAGRFWVNRTADNWLMILLSSADKETVLYPHTITDGVNNIYPEHLYRHPFTEGTLCCAETFAAYRTASRFWPLHQIFILQAAVDRFPEIFNWHINLAQAKDDIFTEQERKMMETLNENWRLTHSMRLELNNLCASYKTSGGLSQILAACFDTVCENKQERAAAFGRLRRKLCE